jgi:hypothetical protein
MEYSFEVGAIYQFWIELRGFLRDLAFVTVVIKWRQRVGDRWHCGAEVLTSSKAWLGPGEAD